MYWVPWRVEFILPLTKLTTFCCFKLLVYFWYFCLLHSIWAFWYWGEILILAKYNQKYLVYTTLFLNRQPSPNSRSSAISRSMTEFPEFPVSRFTAIITRESGIFSVFRYTPMSTVAIPRRSLGHSRAISTSALQGGYIVGRQPGPSIMAYHTSPSGLI